ncbi:hypothetical protein [Actinoplanes couchii]|uniref:Secreted protein n=1 Tax=Actinoplanes couchii TaxID=403638 RepID=A0ABQ3X1Q7_9ACTN|nr:hypothetical protein [Actinoplanes couchii]MDR6316796.1 hypothetical protein [Actinoplanes couchii]GID52403.1 hypothetical protein Aco03nite_008070 [Actinoplanes couchii]
MKNVMRTLALSGMTLAAGALLGISPAQAAPAAAQSAGTVSVQSGWDDDEYVADYYDDRSDCERAGRFGYQRGYWDDYYCTYASGSWDGSWALVVEEYRRWNR